ncbi:MAG: ATP-binding cassette domain-containing protein [Verrucomicrobia bacterium]|nr:ATP-binding cassette domain-containing protein [Verrucomicrobiota bacterium]
MIQAIELTRKFHGTTAVDRVSFKVGAGQTLGLIGTSGCGKTTTLRMLNRLIEPTSGRVLLGGRDVAHQNPECLRRAIGYVIQSVGLFPHYTVEDNVAVVPRLLRHDEGQISRRTAELLDLVGLPPAAYSKRFPHELSGGQQQRVGFARALAADPPVILLDEPFGGLDQITRGQIQRDFKTLQRCLGKTVVLVTHDVFEAVFMCDQLCLMDRGIIQQSGTPADLLFEPANDFVRDFFRSQQFLASLQVVRLCDLSPHLPFDAPAPGRTPLLTVEWDISLLDLVQQFQNHDTASLVVSDADGTKILNTTIPSLLAAFWKLCADRRKRPE